MVSSGLILAVILTLACATPAAPKLVVHESLSSVPHGFVREDQASASTPLNLRIALRSNNMDGLHNALYDVSTPSSPHYGQHLTKAEVEEFVKPSTETIDAVNKWLASYGVKASPISPAGEWLSFDVDVKTANKLLGANFSAFTHTVTGIKSVRTLSYSIPDYLKDHVDLVHPTTTFPIYQLASPVFSIPGPPPPNNTSPDIPASCSQSITPACLQAMYGIPTRPATQVFNALGVTGFEGSHAQDGDLEQFLRKFRPDLSPFTGFEVQTLDGGNNTQGPGENALEANIDIQYTVGLASNVPVAFISVGDQTSDNVMGYLDLVQFLLAENVPTQVLTTSYGFNESDLSPGLEINLCNAYAQLGARGVSILFASGDGGVSGGYPTQNCTFFRPTFPASCPFITAVGASSGVNPETALSLSSGGFSNVFPTPTYQTTAVASYLDKLGGLYLGLYNPGGRGFPDVAAAGANVTIILHGQQGPSFGTSCSSPIFASVIALLNDELAAAERPPLGFLNPFLYFTGASALNDITLGSNLGCNTEGFPAAPGWDPVTGLGTPNYPALRAAIGL